MAPRTATGAVVPRAVNRFSKSKQGDAESRSTSAGSVPSDSQVSLQTPPETPPQASLTQGYPSSNLGVPEYDYPAPFPGASALPEFEYPSNIVVKNTFYDADKPYTLSLMEFLNERQTKSAPVSGASLGSGISLPPGLEDMYDPEETSKKLAVAYSTSTSEAPTAESAETRVTPSSQNHLLPSDLMDDVNFGSASEALRSPGTEAWFSPASSELAFMPQPSDWQPATVAFAQYPGEWNPHWAAAAAALASSQHHQASQAPVILDLAGALGSPVAPSIPDQYAVPGFCLPQFQNAEAVQPAEVGSALCPTKGSIGHWTRECKPCAFLYTKGCSNGVGCEFCHLCDAGEKKRRAKDKRAAFQEEKRTYRMMK